MLFYVINKPHQHTVNNKTSYGVKKQCCSFLSIIQNFLQIHFYRFIVLPDLVKIRSNLSTICIFVIAYYYPFYKRTFISQIVC